MRFEIGDWVVYPAFGVGKIVGVTTKAFHEAERHLYYEVTGDRSTVWVQVDESTARGLRHLTRQSELADLRTVLRGQPVALNGDFRQRRLDIRDQLRRGTLQAQCEVVRDLSGRAWRKSLSEGDLFDLNKTSDSLCREWAAANQVSVAEATTEVNAILLEARREYSGGSVAKTSF